VSATTTPQARPARSFERHPDALGTTARLIFDNLQGMHGLGAHDSDLLSRAAAGLRFIRCAETYSIVEQRLFRLALVGLDETDSFLVEAAACYAADLIGVGDSRIWWQIAPRDERRALWFAATLRLADALCQGGTDAPEDVYAAWTDAILYLEFDGDCVGAAHLARARQRVAALEALTGRRVELASSAVRRGAA